jgi:hypothetical protein
MAKGGSGSSNISIGTQAMELATTSDLSIAIGYQALRSTTGASNVAIGYQSFRSNTTGIRNIGLGAVTGLNNTTGSDNTLLGSAAGTSNTIGTCNVAVGSQALWSNTTGNYNVAVGGYNALNLNTSGSGNVGIGTTSPTQKLEIHGGNDVGISIFNTNANYWDITNGSNGTLNFIRGRSNTYMKIDQFGNVGIGTPSPSAKLHISGGVLASSGTGIMLSSELTTGRMGTYDASSLGSIHTFFDASSLELTAGSTNGWVSGVSVTGNNSTLYAGTVRFATASAERMRININGNVGIGTDNPTEKLEVSGVIKSTQFKLSALNTAPASATATGTLGEIRVTADYIYVCFATNQWKRCELHSDSRRDFEVQKRN